jgi:hypothetical protein
VVALARRVDLRASRLISGSLNQILDIPLV